ncbi:hypothetical protein OS493_027461 [Desmophyllum pertusum]|uniref:Uncharacterized protein n=1 Tax=Desmophyllum pertusum TaxID=174260 RepID=A0A9W9Y9F0_9CNID|nr:hypothetical protein OS493_027461 [Desmophyllum pertusum]
MPRCVHMSLSKSVFTSLPASQPHALSDHDLKQPLKEAVQPAPAMLRETGRTTGQPDARETACASLPAYRASTDMQTTSTSSLNRHADYTSTSSLNRHADYLHKRSQQTCRLYLHKQPQQTCRLPPQEVSTDMQTIPPQAASTDMQTLPPRSGLGHVTLQRHPNPSYSTQGFHIP